MLRFSIQDWVETGPITVSQKHPMHNFRAKRNVLEMSIFTKDLMDVEVGLGEKLKGVRPMKQEGFLNEITNVRLSGIPKEGQGISFRIKPGERGCLCGISTYMDMG